MLINSKRRLVAVIAVLSTLSLLAGTATFLHSLNMLRQEVENTFHSRAALIGTFVALHRDQVAVMRNLLVDNYRAPAVRADLPQRLRERPEYRVWELEDTQGQFAGRLSGNAALPLSEAQLLEVQAALTLDAQMRPALEFHEAVVWLYYLSASGFIYMAPDSPLGNFHFTPELYRRDYWRESAPALNPQRRMILDGPYQDAAGQGWIFTFAQPVYAGERFLGVVALDLRLDTLQQLVVLGEAAGETMLVSENAHLIARPGGFEPGTHLRPPLGDRPVDWHADEQGNHWLSAPVVADELWAVHRLEPHTLLWAAVRESAPTWLLILMLGLLCLFAWRLMGALAQMTRMTHVDPLTQTLNRRGFYEKAGVALALAARKRLVPAVLLMDIDHFKTINDSYGHAVGDSVLKQLGGHLRKACRPFDLVCRWGGEEFVIVLLLDAPAQARQSAERMREAAQRTRIQPGDRPVTLSGGLVLLGEGESLDQAIKRADQWLYSAKANGRNHIEHDPGL